MSKYSRSGGKFCGSHTTLTPAACLVADIAEKCSAVDRISPGYLKAGLKPVNGQRRVKIIDHGTRILFAVRDNTSQQEVHVFAGDRQKAKLAIARGIRDAGLHISFEKIRPTD